MGCVVSISNSKYGGNKPRRTKIGIRPRVGRCAGKQDALQTCLGLMCALGRPSKQTRGLLGEGLELLCDMNFRRDMFMWSVELLLFGGCSNLTHWTTSSDGSRGWFVNQTWPTKLVLCSSRDQRPGFRTQDWLRVPTIEIIPGRPRDPPGAAL